MAQSTYVRAFQLICSIAALALACLNLSTWPCLCALLDCPCGRIEQDRSRGFTASGRWVWLPFGQKPFIVKRGVTKNTTLMTKILIGTWQYRFWRDQHCNAQRTQSINQLIDHEQTLKVYLILTQLIIHSIIHTHNLKQSPNTTLLNAYLTTIATYLTILTYFTFGKVP